MREFYTRTLSFCIPMEVSYPSKVKMPLIKKHYSTTLTVMPRNWSFLPWELMTGAPLPRCPKICLKKLADRYGLIGDMLVDTFKYFFKGFFLKLT